MKPTLDYRRPGTALESVTKAKAHDARFVIPPLMQIQRVLQINIRGRHAKVNPKGGTFKLPEDPTKGGSIGYVLFFKAGSPIALALMIKCDKVMFGDFEIGYAKPQWLCDAP